MPKESLGMFGERLDKLVCIRCRICGRFTAIRLDPEDLDRHVNGVFVQYAFANRNGKPYLDAGERELLISRLCPEDWELLCPDPITHPFAYN
jgi:hypothetical protein